MARNLNRLIFGLLLTLVLAFNVSAASARSVCNDRDIVVKKLTKEFHEENVNIAVTNSGALLEVYSSGENGTWSIVVTSPNSNRSCLILAGKGWYQLELPHSEIKIQY